MFISPTKGKLTIEEVMAELIVYMGENSRLGYRLIIGTDSSLAGANHSSPRTQGGCAVDFVNAIVIHRVGRGGRYFWRRIHQEYSSPLSLKARIFSEANYSIALALELLVLLQTRLADAFLDIPPGIEVHIDVGENGPTREMIKELVGLVKSNGFEARIKPEAYAASTVADKYS